LSKYGEFFPFGAAISSEGELEMLAASPGMGERPISEDVLRALRDGAKASADARRAVAFAADVRVSAGDAVRVDLEHRDGAALVVLVPYSRGRFKKTVTFGQMSGSSGQPVVWGPA
jgi:hypothetical protein